MMTREQIERDYRVQNGIIRNPGMFEHEPVWLPAFWGLVLDGAADETVYDEYDRPHDVFVVTPEDVAQWPELRDAVRVEVWQDDQGFVRANVFAA